MILFGDIGRSMSVISNYFLTTDGLVGSDEVVW
jgi:hypothetical protein